MKWGRIGLALITALQFQAAFAQRNSDRVDTGLFPIDVSPTNGTSVDDLFPSQPRIGITPPQGGSTPNTGSTPAPNTGGTNTGGANQNNGSGNGLPIVVKDSGAGVKEDFKCNLFASTNNEYYDILAAANALNQAVGSPSCTGNQISAQTVADNNKKITDAITALQPFLQNPETVQPEQVPTIVNTVDGAIRAANSLATTFASTDIMKQSCRDQMNGGQIALALNDMINGLTPYALMAASMTGGTAAVPFIVGGSVITSAIGAMEKIVNDNSTKIKDPQVRRAVVENTCQFIRLDQKYKFLTRNRDEQVSKISKEMIVARNYSAKFSGVSNTTNSLMVRKNEMSQAAFTIETELSNAGAQLALDKQFIQSTTDDVKICQLGIQLADMAKDQNSYVAVMLNSVNDAMDVYGSRNIPQARALKASGEIAISSLNKMANMRFNFNTDFTPCSRATKSLVETIEQSATLSRQVVKLAQNNLDKELKASPEYQQIQARLTLLNQKQQQATRLTNSLDNLRKYATTFNQSEIDAEMDRLRSGLFGTRTLGISSPVMAWFDYTSGLHRAAVAKFKTGLQSLQTTAYKLTVAGSTAQAYGGPSVSLAQAQKDKASGDNLETLTLAKIEKDSKVYNDVCRETQDVWNRWVTAVDHLAAMESFCSMINNYIYDNRSEDRALVQLCRGGQASIGVGSYQSDLGQLKATILNEKTNAWANLVKKRINALGCTTPTSF